MDSPTFTGKRIVLRPNADEITRLSEGSISINNTSGEWLLQRQSSPRERRSTPVIRVPSTPKNVQAPTYHCDPDAGNHMAYHTPLARPPAHRYKDQNSPDRTPNGAERRLLSSMPDDDSTPPFMTASITSHHPEMDFQRPASIVITPDEGSTNNKPRVSLGEVTTMDASSDGDAHAAGCCCCCGGAISRMWDTFKVSAKYVTADVYRRPRNTIIGFIAVLLLVFFSGVVMLAISKAPCILLRLAELTVGEMDVVFYSGGSSNPLLNFTALLPDIMGGNEVHGTSPRWIVKAGISNSNQSLSTVANLIVADTKREIQSGIGRGWPYRAIGFGEAQVFYSAAEYVDTSPEAGERVFLTVDPSNLAENVSLPEITVNRPTTVTSYPDLLLQAFFQMNNIQGDSFNAMDAITPSVYATMESAIQSSYGKYPSSLGNVVMLDSTALPSMVVSESCLLGAPSINTNPENGYYFPTPASLLGLPTEKLEDFRLADYAMMIIAIFKGRYSMYYSSSNKMQRLMVLKSNSMMFAMGIDSFNGTVQYPLVTALEAYDTFKVLLISTVVVVVVCLVFLGSILMFALLRINAEERQFELAMLRATGAPAFYLVVAFVLQTLMFAVPATFFGIGLMWIANVIIESILTNFTYAPTRAADIPVYAGLLCTFLGLVLPLVAVWGPIANALGTSLRNALDIYRQAQNESTVVMQRLEEMGLAGWQVALGVFLTVAGFMIYYMVPLAFIFQNILLFFLMMELVLLCMIVGLCMMTYVLQPLSEKVVLKALLWGGERRLEDLILKNLRSHRERNSKAYMMFLLSVACLMAAGVMFAELSQVSADMAELANGAQITLTSSSFASPINETVMDAFLSTQSKYVAAWAYSSFELTSYPQMGTNTYISSLIGKSRSVNTISVSKNFMNAVYPKFNMVQSYAKGYKYPKTSEGKMDVVKSMYDEAPHAPSVTNVIPIGTGFDSGIPIPDVSRKLTFRVPIMIAAAAKDLLGITTTSGSLISFWYRTRIPGGTNYPSTTIYAEPRALMKRVSGFFAVSSLPVLFSTGSIMMPESYFLTLLDLTRIDYEANSGVEIAYGAVLEIRQKVLYVRLHGGTSERNRIRVVNAIQAMDNSPDHTLTDTSALVAQLESVRKMIMIFFYCTAAVASILCAFMLWVTFIATVQHSAWVFGVLRSLGFTTAQLIRAAIYEALCIVISGFVIGLTVGVLVGLTMVIQLSGFMVLPFSFQVPYVLLILLLVMGVLAAVVGSSLPFWSLSSKPIAQVLRGL